MVVGIAMVRDELDIIDLTVRHMAQHCDSLLIADNGSTDGTRELLDALPCEVVDDEEPGYFQSGKMSALAAQARERGAEWVVPFDADEIWLTTGSICDLLSSLPPDCMTAEASLLDHVATPGYEVPSPWRRTQVLPLRKVACRAVEGLVIHQGNHGASFPGNPRPMTVTGQLEVRHFPYRSPEQFIRKARNGAAAYAATDLPEDVGKHWRDYGRLSDEQLCEVFNTWFFSDDPANDPKLVHDPCAFRS